MGYMYRVHGSLGHAGISMDVIHPRQVVPTRMRVGHAVSAEHQGVALQRVLAQNTSPSLFF
jgi:hypothetical protein